MTNDQRAALRRLSKDKKLAFTLAKALNREVAHSSFERSIFCSSDGELYVAWKPVSPFDKNVTRLQACDLNLDIGEGREYETFEDVEDSLWDSEAEGLQEIAGMLAEEELE
jgi:hypothetical protein